MIPNVRPYIKILDLAVEDRPGKQHSVFVQSIGEEEEEKKFYKISSKFYFYCGIVVSGMWCQWYKTLSLFVTTAAAK